MTFRFLLRALGAVVGVTLLAGVARAGIVYVDASNGGLENGSIGNPYNTIEEGIAAAIANDTVQVAAGSYTPAAALVIAVPLTMLGPQAGVNPRSDAGPLRTAGGAAEAVVNSGLLTNIVSIQASDVTVDGFDFLTTVSSGNIIATAGATRNNVTVASNFFRRATLGAGTDPAQNAVWLASTTASSIRNNFIRNIAGQSVNATNEGLTGILTLINSTGGSIVGNEVLDTNSADFVTVIRAQNSAGATLVSDNYIHGAVGKLAISVIGTNTGTVTVRGNNVQNFQQAGINIQSPNVTCEYNEITTVTTPAVSITRAGIYVRDATCQNIILRYNYVHDTKLYSTTGGHSGGNPTAGGSPESIRHAKPLRQLAREQPQQHGTGEQHRVRIRPWCGHLHRKLVQQPRNRGREHPKHLVGK